ncbi:hypothetical protein THRCLA_01212 [Thraustotheca clavata]|uniref:J domain-containing protein n=1 Tax=Thraustotheca clavata TaxID=74557 RepID=A0A1W0A912_9STRA|nr:hypothetical protein THRCLA_01212 [Thraustotheca clavata]
MEEVTRILAAKNHYAVLGLEHVEITELVVIRRQYKLLARSVHPDKNAHAQAEDAFKKLSLAYECLADKASQANYHASITSTSKKRRREYGVSNEHPRKRSSQPPPPPMGRRRTPQEIFEAFMAEEERQAQMEFEKRGYERVFSASPTNKAKKSDIKSSLPTEVEEQRETLLSSNLESKRGGWKDFRQNKPTTNTKPFANTIFNTFRTNYSLKPLAILNMRVTDEALLRSRSKAPLDQIEVLYVDHCGIEAFENLDPCKTLRCLYANNNKLVDITDLEVLPQLWYIDLSHNKNLHNLTPLSSCQALGYLALRNNNLTFKDLVPLRDIHIIALYLDSNETLLEGNDIMAYRMIVAALLPNIWTLDGHFISAGERMRAMEIYDNYVQFLLTGDTDRFGATAALWTQPNIQHKSNPLAARLLDFVVKEPTRPQSKDFNRLRYLLQLYDSLACLHNNGLALASLHHKGTIWPRASDEIFCKLSPHHCLHFILLTILPIEFSSVPLTMVADALTINLLGQVDSALLNVILHLPLYVQVALVHHLIAVHQTSITTFPEAERQIWASLPDIFMTFLPPKVKNAGIAENLLQRRYCYTVVLLSRAPGFPSLLTTVPESTSEYTALKPLLIAARMDLKDLYPSIDVGTTLWAGTASGNDHNWNSIDDLPWNKKDVTLERKYDRPWDIQRSSSSPSLMTTSSKENKVIEAPLSTGVQIGEWVEVRRRQYVPILSVSNDSKYVVLASFKGQDGPPFNGSAVIPTSQLLRATHKVWKIINQTTAPIDSLKDKSKKLCGPLHRTSHAFHRNGLPRYVGVPNFDVNDQDAKEALENMPERDSSGIMTTVEGFVMNSTWDANYVLAPPSIVDVQNYCAAKNNSNQTWSTIEAPYYIDQGQIASHNVYVQPRQLGPIRDHISSQRLNIHEPIPEASCEPEEPPGMQIPTKDTSLDSIQHDMALLLGKSLPNHSSDTVFITSLQEMPSKTPPTSIKKSLSTTSIAISPKEVHKQPKAGYRSWHAVAAKPQLIVQSMPTITQKPPQNQIIFEFTNKMTDVYMQSSTTIYQTSEAMETMPRIRWSDGDHRFHFNIPLCEQPGKDGFVLVHEVDNVDSVLLSPKEKKKLTEMEKVNEMIHEVELAEQIRDTIKKLEHKRSHEKTNKERYEERTYSQKSTEDVTPVKKHFNQPKPQFVAKKNPKPKNTRTLKQPSRSS